MIFEINLCLCFKGLKGLAVSINVEFGDIDWAVNNYKDFGAIISVISEKDIKAIKKVEMMKYISGCAMKPYHIMSCDDIPLSQEYSPDCHPATEEMISDLFTFVGRVISSKRVLHGNGNILIHCNAGISRSSATAMAVMTYMQKKLGGIPFDFYERLPARLLSACHSCGSPQPNSLIVDISDRVLNLKGALTALI